jgi:hypothetical protein
VGEGVAEERAVLRDRDEDLSPETFLANTFGVPSKDGTFPCSPFAIFCDETDLIRKKVGENNDNGENA